MINLKLFLLAAFLLATQTSVALQSGKLTGVIIGTVDFPDAVRYVRGRGNTSWEFPPQIYYIKLNNKVNLSDNLVKEKSRILMCDHNVLQYINKINKNQRKN